MNKFLVSSGKGWYHLEVITLVFKCSRQVASTTASLLCTLKSLPTSSQAWAGCKLSSFGSVINVLQTNLAASLKQSCPLLLFLASSPTSVKRRMLIKNLASRTNSWNEKVNGHTSYCRRHCDVNHYSTHCLGPQGLPPFTSPHLLLILLINKFLKSHRKSLFPSLLDRCDLQPYRCTQQLPQRSCSWLHSHVRSPGTCGQLCLGAEVLTGVWGWGTHTFQFPHLSEGTKIFAPPTSQVVMRTKQAAWVRAPALFFLSTNSV